MSLSVAFPSQKGYQEAVKHTADDLMFAASSMVHTSRNPEKPASESSTAVAWPGWILQN